MGWFSRRNDYDRKHLLRDAREAQRRGKHKQTVSLLRRILVVEPNNVEIHALIAPSLAERGLEFSAWESYVRTATALLRDGKKQLALDFYQDATRRMPRHYEAWISRCAMERSMGRTDEAKRSIADALPHFRRRAARYPLISLLRRLMELDPNDRSALLELAAILSKSGQKEEALMLLASLAKASNGPFLRKVRRTQWNVTPSLTHSWLWLRSRMASS